MQKLIKILKRNSWKPTYSNGAID